MRVIYSKEESKICGEPSFWSNRMGWVSIKCASRFKVTHDKILPFPLDSKWIDYKEAKKMVENS